MALLAHRLQTEYILQEFINMKQEEGQPQAYKPRHTSEEHNVLETVDNVNRKYTMGKSEYILLIKKQKQKQYCTLYITDCETRFWIKKIDQIFLLKLKDTMSINTELNVFTQHFAKNLKQNSKLLPKEEEMKIEIELKIGEGLTMNCQFYVQSSISASQNPQDFKMILRNFLKQLYEAKESQIEEQRKKWMRMMEDDGPRKMPENEKGNAGYIKEVLNPIKKDAKEIKPKNRNLMNPNLKKRKVQGIKFEGDI